VVSGAAPAVAVAVAAAAVAAAALTADIVDMGGVVSGGVSEPGTGGGALGAFTSSAKSIFDVARPVVPSNV